MTDDRLVSTKKAAELLGVQPQTLAKWRLDGRNGLPIVRLGRTVRYRMSDVEKLMAQGACQLN